MMSAVRIIESYVHNGRVAVLVELSVESDYAARTDEFKTLAQDIAMHIAASSPESVASLLQQPFVKEPACSVGQLLANTSAALGERVSVTRFVRWDTASKDPAQPEPPKSPAMALRA
jgi:elongation factor Ts